MPQAPQLRPRRADGEAAAGRGGHQGRAGLVQRQGHALDRGHRAQGNNTHKTCLNIFPGTKIFSRPGLRQQPGGERRARGAGGAGRQLLVAEHGAGAADPHPEQPRQGHPREGVQHAARGDNIIYISIYLLYLNNFHNAVLFAAWYREEPWKWRPQLVMMQ